MTTEKLQQANELAEQIAAAQALKSKHLHAIKEHMAELTADQAKAIADAVCTIHDGMISALQNQFNTI